MKSSIVLFTFVLSTSAMAISTTSITEYISPSPGFSTIISKGSTSGGFAEKQAALVLNDSQEYFQSGRLSAFLAQKVSEVQAESELSVEEAVDALVTDAESILK